MHVHQSILQSVHVQCVEHVYSKQKHLLLYVVTQFEIRHSGMSVCGVVGESVSEPHASKLAGEFSICMVHHMYIIRISPMIYLSGALP